LSLRASVAFRRGAFAAAEKDYRAALTIRQRIAAAEGYGKVNAYSLFSWAYAARRSNAASERTP